MLKQEHKRRDLGPEKSLIAIAVFLVFTLCIYAPYELYITNRDEFWFKLCHFWWMPLIYAGILMLIILLAGSFLKGKLLLCYEAVLVAIAFDIYIQGNFLNLDLGVMNGAEILWESYRVHFVIDAFIWVLVIIAALWMGLKKANLFHKVATYASIFLSLIQLVTLIVLLVPVIIDQGIGEQKYWVLSDKEILEVGEEENVVVFLLDMFDDEYFKEILEKEPELTEELDGFTYFSNSTGSYSATFYSLASLFTGKLNHNEYRLFDWGDEIAKEDIYLDELTDQGYGLYLYSNAVSFFPDRIVDSAENVLRVPMRISNKLHFSYDIYQLVMCKYFPDCLKPYIWMSGTEFEYWQETDSEYDSYLQDNVIFKDKLEKTDVSVGGETKQFKYIHLDGSHPPFRIDENAQTVDENSVTALQCARGSLRIVQNYMEKLKQSGSYDNTAIIIMADHGYYDNGVLSSPLFMVKPRAAHGSMKVNNAPICQLDFGSTVLELAGCENWEKYGKSVFEIEEGAVRERYFYQYYLEERTDSPEFRLIEYEIDSESNKPSNFHLTDVEYTVDGKKIRHSEYCKTCNGKEGTNEQESDPTRIVHHKDKNYPDS